MAIALRRTSLGIPFWSSHSWSRGTSARQWGHPNGWAPLQEQNWHTRFEGQDYTAMSPDGTAWMQYRQSPDGAAEGAQQLSAKAKENPLPIAVGGALVAGFILGRVTSR